MKKPFTKVLLYPLLVTLCACSSSPSISSFTSSDSSSFFSTSSSNDTSNTSSSNFSSSTSSSSYHEEDPKPSGYEYNDRGFAKLLVDEYQFCEDIMAQGTVLLKNDNVNERPALPLEAGERNVTLLGRGSKNMLMRSNTVGPNPNEGLVITLDKAFEQNGFNINKTVFNSYSKLSNARMTSVSTTVEEYSETNKDELKQTFSSYGDAAIITLVRIGGLDFDLPKGKLNLNYDEKQLLSLAKEYKDAGTFKKIIVLINSPTPLSMDWVNKAEYGVDACLYIGVPGYYGLGGVAKILNGTVNPSGHLSNTFAANASSSPAYQNFGNTRVAVYKEGVYVGYKYYETRYEDLVLGIGNADSTKGVYNSTNQWNYAEEMGFPFGFGLSYTTFEQELIDTKYNSQSDTIEVKIKTKNTGNIAGKASIQLYAQQPYTDFDKENGLGKASIALMAYDKIDVKAGETVTTNLTFDRYFLTTYDNAVNKSYILEGGKYYFALGNDAHEALNNIISVKSPAVSLLDHNGNTYSGKSNMVKSIDFVEDLSTYKKSQYNESVNVTNQFDDADYNYHASNNGRDTIQYLDRQDWENTWPTATTDSPSTSDELNMSQYYQKSDDMTAYYENGNGTNYNRPSNISFADMTDVPLEGVVREGKFKNRDGTEVWDEFVKQMSLDDLATLVTDNRGTTSIKSIGKAGTFNGDGTEGLLARYRYGDRRWVTSYPTGPSYTNTWNHNIQTRLGSFYGEDCIFSGAASSNALGVNINRTPYDARTSEYMSEDGIMNYNVSANIIGAARDKGVIITARHCLLNNQETGRIKLETYCNEQAIREIYLKPFEGALTKGKGLGVMTSINRIGSRYAACHDSLMNNVLRKEWNYQGYITNDCFTGSNNDLYSNGPAMLHCGTDLFYLDGRRGSQLKQWVTTNNDGQILKDMQRASKYILFALSKTWINQDIFKESSNLDCRVFEQATDEMREAINTLNYSFNPDSVIIKEQNAYDFTNIANNVPVDKTRDGDHHIVYCFEGSCADGFGGHATEAYGTLYLWEDGLFGGVVGSNPIRGYWYNSSLANGKDNSGNDIKDCLVMVSNSEGNEYILTSKTSGFYERSAVVYSNLIFGIRAMVLNGYKYYPDVGIAFDSSSLGTDFKVGDYFNPKDYPVVRVLANLQYDRIIDDSIMMIISGKVVSSNYRFTEAGVYTLTARWNDFVATISINVSE